MSYFKTKLYVKSGLLIGFLLTGLTFTGCKDDDDEIAEEPNQTIVQLVVDDPDFSFLEAAVVKADLAAALSAAGPFTVFAPTNDAFIAAGFANEAAVTAAPKETLDAILKYHVLNGSVTSGAIPAAANTETATLGGKNTYITKNQTGVFINGSRVIQADVAASNGTIHVIEKVLMPPVGNVVETAIATPSLSYLVAAVTRASQGSTNVAQVLSGAGPFTVFAPTNDAFIAAGFPTIASINAADPNTLAGILTYHVLAGRVLSSDLTEGASPKTVNGGNLIITLTGGAKVKGAKNATAANIAITDIITTNGVVHVVNQVLLP